MTELNLKFQTLEESLPEFGEPILIRYTKRRIGSSLSSGRTGTFLTQGVYASCWDGKAKWYDYTARLLYTEGAKSSSNTILEWAYLR
jgi:hypothetical protein